MTTESEVKAAITQANIDLYGDQTETKFVGSPVWDEGDFAVNPVIQVIHSGVAGLQAALAHQESPRAFSKPVYRSEHTVTADQARTDAITCLTDIRRDAIAIEDKAEAINFAIQGTLTIVDTAIETVDGAPNSVTRDLAKQLAESWSFEPVAEAAAE